MSESEKRIQEKNTFKTVEEGTQYILPTWSVIEGKGIELTGKGTVIKFVRGSKINKENEEASLDKVDGILHESLLSMSIQDLEYKNNLFPNEDTKIAINNLKEALYALNRRQRKRVSRGVDGQFKK